MIVNRNLWYGWWAWRYKRKSACYAILILKISRIFIYFSSLKQWHCVVTIPFFSLVSLVTVPTVSLYEFQFFIEVKQKRRKKNQKITISSNKRFSVLLTNVTGYTPTEARWYKVSWFWSCFLCHVTLFFFSFVNLNLINCFSFGECGLSFCSVRKLYDARFEI